MGISQETLERTPITAADMARFHRNAPAALGGGPAFVGETFAEGLETFLIGAVPIVGMLRFDWSANQLLLFLLIGSWAAILLDFTKYFFATAAVQRFAAAKFDDWHVWVVVGALREGKTDAPRPHLEAKYAPEMGILVDLACGGIATLIIGVTLATGSEGGLRGLLSDRGVLWSLAGLVGYQLVLAAWEILRQRTAGEQGEMKVLLGMRGLGLFTLMFVIAMFHESIDSDGVLSRKVMLTVNGAIVALAIFNVVGLLWLRGETRWLRDYMRGRPQEPAEPKPRPAKRRGRRSDCPCSDG